MMKIILIIAMALSPMSATREYTYTGRSVEDLGNIRSCGASQRFLKETWRVKIKPPYAWVNGVRWQLLRDNLEGGGVTMLTYKVQEDAHMTMDFVMLGKSANVSIGGIDAQRFPCLDMVKLRRIK